ncbi:hypothetical protein [Nocardia fluminea]|uniref:hypothetical protein n=1 Tax=Nocardia fluminea TaxID=134984 RepID=UPI0034157096
MTANGPVGDRPIRDGGKPVPVSRPHAKRATVGTRRAGEFDAGQIRARLRGGADKQQLIGELRGDARRRAAIPELAYCVWELEGETVLATNGFRPSQSVNSLRRQRVIAEFVLAALLRIEHQAYERRFNAIGSARSAPNHLSALVMQQIGGLPFQKELRRLLEADGLPPNALHPGVTSGWAWARAMGLVENASEQVRLTCDLEDNELLAELLEDAARPGSLPDDPLIAERRADLDAQAMREIRLRIGTAEQHLYSVERSERTSSHFAAVRDVYKLAAAFARRQHQGELIVSDSRIRARELSRSMTFMRRRADYLQRAAEVHAQLNPALWDSVLRAVLTHQRQCPEVRSSFPCAECTPQLAQTIKDERRTGSDEPPKATAAGQIIEQTSDVGRSNESPPERLVSTRVDAVLVAVSASTTARSSTVGLAWVTEDGQVGVAIDQSPTDLEAPLLAVGRAIADLPDDLSLDIVLRGRPTRARARGRLSVQGTAQSADMEGTDTLDLLDQLRGQSPRVRIVNEPGMDDDQLSQAAAELSKVALAAVRGGHSARELHKEIDTVAAKFGVEERKPLLAPTPEAQFVAVTRSTSGEFRWLQPLRRDDVTQRRLPLPTAVAAALDRSPSGSRISLTLIHRSTAIHGETADLVALVTADGLRLKSGYWPRDFFPGIFLDCTWKPSSGRFIAKTRRLPQPLSVEGHSVGYQYDAQVFTRDTAPISEHGGSVADWVILTLRTLGYLDPDGRAVLAEDALERNMMELGFPPAQLPQLTHVVVRLIREGRIQRVEGSLGPDGRPVFPALRYRSPVELLSFRPRIVQVHRDEAPRHQADPRAGQRPHKVSGFVRRLPSGQSASDEALEAHAEARRHAELANDAPLKPGFTFVRKHRRLG